MKINLTFLPLLLLYSCQPSTPAPEIPQPAAARIDTLSIPSPSMNKSIPALAILPSDYFENENERFPVVYLLHGATGAYVNWSLEVPELGEYASNMDLIIICPDGGFTSWYIDSPIDPDSQYETHITDEVIPFVDSVYRTKTQADQRAITGLSMGGHGGLYLGARNPDLFGAAGSMSGGVDIRPFPDNWDIEDRLGTLEEFPERWEENSVVNYDTIFARNDQALIVDCGVDDFFFDVNEDLHERLIKLEVPHDYITRPGGHTWEYWRNAIEYQLLFFSKEFEEPK